MALVRTVNAQLNRDLCVVLHQKRRAEGDILDVVGTQFDLDQKSMKDTVLLRLQAVQYLAFPDNRNTTHTLKSATLKLDSNKTGMAFWCQGLTHGDRILKSPRALFAIGQLSSWSIFV